MQSDAPVHLYGALRPELVARLAGLSRGQLRRWRQDDIVQAHVSLGGTNAAHLYSWTDYMAVRAAEKLYRQGVRGDRLRAALAYLNAHVPGWYNMPLVGYQGEVLIDQDGILSVALPGRQLTFPELRTLLLQIVEEGPLGQLRSFADAVTMNPAVLAGTPVVRGTRVETALIHGLKMRGLDIAAIADWCGLPADIIERSLDFEYEVALAA